MDKTYLDNTGHFSAPAAAAAAPVTIDTLGGATAFGKSLVKAADVAAAQTLLAVPAAAVAATATTAGIVKQGVAVPDPAAAPTKDEFVALLASLRTAGVIAS